MTATPFVSRFMVLALFSWLSILIHPAAGHADAVEGPPDNCPAGSDPATSHAGPHCRPRPSCMTDLTCDTGQACEEVRLCVVSVPCGGRGFPDSGPCFEPHVMGRCAADGSCAVGTCLIQNACIAPGSASGGCACGVMQRSRPVLPLLMVGALGLALGYRRRR
jgi:hypothetical protein